MLKKDPYNQDALWGQWKQKNRNRISGIASGNSDLILEFLNDMEIGKNVSPVARKGARSCGRLLGLKSRLLFFTKQFNDKPLDSITKDQIHQLFFNMRKAKILKDNGQPYKEALGKVEQGLAREGLIIDGKVEIVLQGDYTASVP